MRRADMITVLIRSNMDGGKIQDRIDLDQHDRLRIAYPENQSGGFDACGWCPAS